MKKIFIGLLIIEAGAGAYYLLSQKKSTEPFSENRAALLLGKWKMSLPVSDKDSLFTVFQYEFQKDGIALIRDTASATADSSIYEWNKAGELMFKENAADTTTDVFAVLKLTKDSLQVKNKDSAVYLFTRL